MPTQATLSQLFKLAERIQHDDHYFTMMHMASSLPNNLGGKPEKALSYMESIVKATCGLPNVSQPVATRLESVFSQMRSLLQLSSYDKLIAGIRRLCSEEKNSNKCYIPTDWSTKKSGHMIVIKCTKINEDEYDFCILNKGAGSRYHAGISQEGFQHKINYCSATYRFNLNSRLAERFLKGILEIRTAIQMESIYEYGEHDLYHLLTLGKHIPTQFTIAQASTIQRTGCCTITCSKLVVKDLLLSEFAYTELEVKHVMLMMRTVGLFAALKSTFSTVSSLFLQQALRAFDYHVLKLFPECLSQSEFNQALQISQLVTNKIEQMTEIAEQKLTKLKLPATKRLITETYSTPEPSKQAEVPDKKIYSFQHATREKADISFEKREWRHPCDINQKIDDITIGKDGCSQISALTLLRSLPATCGKKDDPFYDQLNNFQRQHMMNNLFKLAQLVEKKRYVGETDQYALEIHLRIFDLYIQLCEKEDEYQFNGQYTLKLDTEHFSLFQHPDITTQHFVKELVTRIKDREKNRIVLFGPQLSLKGVCATRKYIFQNWFTGDNKAKIYDLYKTNNNLQPRDDDVVLHWLFETIVDTPITPLIQLSAMMHSFHNRGTPHYEGSLRSDMVVNGYDRFKSRQEFRHDACYVVADTHAQDMNIVSQANFNNREPNPTKFNSQSLGSRVGDFKKLFPKQFPLNAAFFDWSENIIYGPLPKPHKDNDLFTSAIYSPYQFKSGVIFSLHQVDDSFNSIENTEQLQQIASFNLAPSCRVTRVLAYATRIMQGIFAGANQINERDLVKIIKHQIYAYGALEHAFTFQAEITLQAFYEFFALVCEPKEYLYLVRESVELISEFYKLLQEAADIYHLPLDQFQWPSIPIKDNSNVDGMLASPDEKPQVDSAAQKILNQEFEFYFYELMQINGWKAESRIKENHCELVSIQHPEINLLFNYNNNKFESNEFAGYELSLKPTLAFSGNLRFITLVHPNKPSILLLAKRGFSNDVKNYSDNPFKSTLFENGYFTYFIDKTGNINSEDHHALFYYAYIAKAMGDYRLAIKLMKQSYYWENNDELLVKLYRVLTNHYTDSTPLSAAFHLHAVVRMIHHNKKITKNRPYDNKHDPHLNLLKEEFRKYRLSLSSNKEKLSLIPSDLQLNQSELEAVAAYLELPNIDFQVASSHDLCRDQVNKKIANVDSQNIGSVYLSLRKSVIEATTINAELPELGIRLKVRNDSSSASKFLNRHFSTYLKLICLQDPETTKLCFSHLFSLLHNQLEIPSYIRDEQGNDIHNIMPTQILLLLFAHKIQYQLPQKDNYNDENCLIRQFTYWRTKEKSNLLTYFNIEHQPAPKELLHKHPALVNERKIAWPSMKEVAESTTEINELFQQFFIKESLPVASGEFPLTIDNSNQCDAALLKRLQDGHAINRQKLIEQYHLHPDKSAQNLQSALIETLGLKQQHLRKAKSKLIQLFSPMQHARADIINLMQKCLAIPMLDTELAVRTLSKADLTPILNCLPTLLPDEAEELIVAVYEYMIAENAVDLIKDALVIINEDPKLPTHQQHLLAQTLAKKRNYIAKAQPSFLTYEFFTHRIIRSQQLAAIHQLEQRADRNAHFGYAHSLLEFDAGGGKGEVITPLLIELELANPSGLLPVVVLTRELYQPGIDVLTKRLQVTFGRQVEVIIRDINDDLNKEELSLIDRSLQYWKENRRCLIIQSGTWHAINLAKKMAYSNSDSNIAKLAEKILAFFKNECLKIEDEAHITSDPIEETVISFGEISYLPKYEFEFLMLIYEYLTAHNMPEYQKLADKMKLCSGSKLHINSENQLWIQIHLIRIITQLPIMKKLSQIDLHIYLRDNPETDPAWLEKLQKANPELAGIIDLAVEFIHQLLPHILTMQLGKDYGRSTNTRDYLTVPKVDGNDVMTHFSHLRLVAALTIQRYWQTGLIFEEACTWLRDWDDKIREEITWNTSGVLLSKIERDQFLPQDHALHQHTRLKSIDVIRFASGRSICKHYPIVKHFLMQYAFPQNKMRTQRVTSSPYDLQAGFATSIKLTATAGLTACYPIYLNQKNVMSNESFEAQVLTTLLSKQNQTLCILDDTQAGSNLSTLFKENNPSPLFANAVSLIDRGALFANMSSNNINVCLQNGFAPSHQLFFQYSNVRGLMCYSANKITAVRANSVGDDLQREGILIDNHQSLYFLDLAHTTGVDLKLPYQSHALLTVGKSQTTTQTIQATMRMRQLLNPNGQHLVWMMLKSFYLELSQDMQQFSLPKLLTWMLKNEAKQSRVRVLMSARQGIHFIIEKHIYDSLNQGSQPSVALQKALQTTHWQKVDESKLKKDSMKNYLQSMTDQICAAFQISFKNLSNQSKTMIAIIIERAANLLQDSQIVGDSNLNAQEYSLELSHEQTATAKEQQQLKSQVKDNQYHSGLNFQYCVEQYDLVDHPDTIFGAALNDRYPLFQFNDCKAKLPKLHMHIPHFTTITVKGFFKYYSPYLKPVQGLLICIQADNSISEPVACTITGMRFYEMQLRSTQSNNRYVLMDAQGSLIAKSNNCLLKDALTVKQNSMVLEALSFAGLLNGQIRFAKTLAQIVKKYDWKSQDFMRMNQEINAMHTSHAEIKTYDAKVYELLLKIAELTGNASDNQPVEPVKPSATTALVARNSLFAFADSSKMRSSVDEQRAWYSCYYRTN